MSRRAPSRGIGDEGVWHDGVLIWRDPTPGYSVGRSILHTDDALWVNGELVWRNPDTVAPLGPSEESPAPPPRLPRPPRPPRLFLAPSDAAWTATPIAPQSLCRLFLGIMAIYAIAILANIL
jgi:hypothetical protein